MQFADSTFYGVPLTTWALALGLVLLTLTLLIVVRRLVQDRLSALARQTTNTVDDLAADLARRVRLFSLVALSLYAAAMVLVLPARVERLVEAVVVVALVLQGALWGNALIGYLVRREVNRRLAEGATSAMTIAALGFLGRLFLWSVLLLVGLDNLGIDITALVAGLGIGGVAVALAVQNVLGDLFASLAIILDRPFIIGDFIIVDDLMGTVEHVGLKTTRIRSLSGEQIVFSNADLLQARIRNFKRMHERRISFTLGITYDTPADQVEAIPGMIREIIERQPEIRFDRAHFAKYGDFALIFEVVYFVLSPDYNRYMDIQQAINLAVLRRFSAEGIQFAFPTQTVLLQPATRAA